MKNKTIIIRVPINRYPQSAQHILDVLAYRQRTGAGIIFTLDRSGASKRRRQALRGIAVRSGYDRDEFPMACLKEGGSGSDIRYIAPSDNRGCGAFIAHYLRAHGIPDGARIMFVVY